MSTSIESLKSQGVKYSMHRDIVSASVPVGLSAQERDSFCKKAKEQLQKMGIDGLMLVKYSANSTEFSATNVGEKGPDLVAEILDNTELGEYLSLLPWKK
jgi:hypothetical protein